MVGTLEGAINFSIAIALNNAYRYGSYDCPNRCNPLQSHCTDCSGLIVASWHSQGAARSIDCTGSFAIARLCHQRGLGVSIDRTQPGDLLFIGRNEGQGRLDGSADGVWPGHVARKCRGPSGQVDWVVEARNHRAGVTYAPAFYGRGWNYAARDPFLSGTTPVPPKPPVEEGDPEMVVIEVTKSSVAVNKQPYGWLDTKNRRIWSHNAFRIKWDGGGEGTLQGTKDPHWMNIPGSAAVIGWVQLSRSDDGKERRICVYGAAGGEWLGTAHG